MCVLELCVCYLCIFTYMGPIAEEVNSQLVAHSIITFIISELNKCDHLLNGSESFHPLLVVFGLSYCLAYPFQSSYGKSSKSHKLRAPQLKMALLYGNTVFG